MRRGRTSLVAVKLLVVADDLQVRTSIFAVLKQLGYDVRSAEDGFSALSKIRKQLPDIILSDLNMPGMSGFELLSVVRRCFPSIRVVVMSGTFSESKWQPGVSADDFYEKATTLLPLLQSIQALIEEKAESTRLRRPRSV